MPALTSKPIPSVPHRLRVAALLTAAATAVVAACTGDLPGGGVVGSGDVVSEVREVPDFSEVEAHGGIRIELVTGDPTSVVVTAQRNLLPITTTTVGGSRLTVETTRGYTTMQGITVKVTMPRVRTIALNGGASASGAGLTAQSLALDLSGGARLTLSGTAGDLDLNASGGAIIDLGELRARNADVDLSGGVLATLRVSSSLTGNASGGVVITLAERPASTDVETSGGAVVNEP